MSETVNFVLLYIAGCAGGFLSGLLGVGGGIIFVPIFDYFLRLNGVVDSDLVSYTLANSFFAVMISGFTGSFGAFKNRDFDFKNFYYIALSAIFFILLTTYIISISNWYSPAKFKIIFCIMLLVSMIKTLIHKTQNDKPEKMNNKISLFAGSITGVISGLSGIGGGVIMIPIFTVFGNMPIRKASILSLAVIPVLALPNVVFYLFGNPSHSLNYSTGYISWFLVLPLIAGVITTVKLGLKTAKMLSSQTIKTIFAVFIIITLIKILFSI
ncbi:MAG: sulfite exporter TauE/SafE family protein [Bacteroidia bacterium]|nr:sulfite exporter TauE/SafE family protein [Bacteroidia bacterium]